MCDQVTEHMADRPAGWLSLSLGGHGSTCEVSSLPLLLLLFAVTQTFVPTRISQFQSGFVEKPLVI